MADPMITNLAAAALSCLNTAVTGSPNPPQNVCYRVEYEPPHELTQWTDICCEGLAYVSMGDQFVSFASFPEADIVRQAEMRCSLPTWAVQLRLGIVRCIPTLGEDGEPPTCQEQADAFQQEIIDAKSLRWAACCLRSWVLRPQEEAFRGMQMTIDRQQKVTLGGCMERYVPVTVQFTDCDC